MNVAGMILGIIAICFGFIPIAGAFIAIPCVGVGLPLSAVSFVRKRRLGEGVGMAIAGLATNIVALVLTIMWIVLFIIGANVED